MTSDPEQITNPDLPPNYAEKLLADWPAEELLKNNLEALRTRNEGLANKIGTVTVPKNIKLAVANDGSVTFKTEQDGKTSWLGHSSTPLISGKANAHHVVTGDANILIDTISHGVEIEQMLQSLSRHLAIIVVETEPLHLNLTFRLRDFCPWLNNGQLVLLCGRNINELLKNFYQKHNGYNIIRQTITQPWRTDQENRRLAESVTLAMQTTADELVVKMNSLRRELSKTSLQTNVNIFTEALADKPELFSVINCTNTTHPIDVCTSRDCLAGLSAIGTQTDWLTYDRPDHVSPLAQLERLKRTQPNLVLLINVLRNGSGLEIPKAAFCATLLREPPDSIFTEPAAGLLGEKDFMFAANSEQLEKLRGCGYPKKQISLLPLAVNHELFCPRKNSDAQQQRYNAETIIIATRTSLDPKHYQINLPFHQQLFNTIADEISRRPQDYRFDQAGKILRRAQRAGIELQTEELKNHFISLTRHCIADSTVRDVYAQKITQAGIDLKIWSWALPFESVTDKIPTNWQQSPVSDYVTGSIGYGKELNALYNSGAIQIFFDSRGTVDQNLLNAVAAETFVLLKSHPDQRKKDGIGEILELEKELITFHDPQDLIEKLRYYLEHTEKRQEIAQTAHQKLLAKHTCRQRMKEMLKFIAGASTPKQ